MQGKYSPTVSAAYAANQQWHRNYMSLGSCIYDPDGYDSYGYNKNDYDRAGNHENDYALDDAGFNDCLERWGFDGTKPFELYPREVE